MKLLWNLSARHLRLNKKRTAITVVGIVLSVAIVTAISGFIVSIQDLMYRDAVARDGLWHLRYAGLTAAQAEGVTAEGAFSSAQWEETEEGVTLSLTLHKLNQGVFETAEAVCARHGISEDQLSYHTDLLISKGIVPGSYFEALYSFAAVLLCLVGAASVLVISNAFSISAAERSRQFGLLKSAGATGGQIRGLVLLEGLTLAGAAIPLGILAGLAAQGVALGIANSILDSITGKNLLVEFRVRVAPWMLAMAVAAALLIILLAAWAPAARAAKVSPVEAIRQTGAVKLRSRRLRQYPLAGKLFGVEGVLAAKTMNRNRGRYRTTVISLVVSIVLFVGVDSFGQMLFKATGMVYEDYDSNVLVTLYGEDKERQDRTAAHLSGWEGVTAISHRSLNGSVDLPPEMITPTAAENLGAGLGSRLAVLYSYSREEFDAFCKKLGKNPDDFRDPANPQAILINTTGTYIRQGRRMDFTPYAIKGGTTLSIDIEGTKRPVTIGAEVREIPGGIGIYYAANALNLVVAEPVRAALAPEGNQEQLVLTVMADDPDGFAQKASDYLSEELGPDGYQLTNFETMVQNSRNIGLLVMIFVYGFIAMLTLIGVTNVVTTVSTGVGLRKREFAMLRSVGMTQRGIGKILGLESLIYGLRSLAWGLPLGLLASLLMYYSLGIAMDFAFIWPVSSMLLSGAAVLILCFATSAFAGRKQRRNNIAATLQEEIA